MTEPPSLHVDVDVDVDADVVADADADAHDGVAVGAYALLRDPTRFDYARAKGVRWAALGLGLGVSVSVSVNVNVNVSVNVHDNRTEAR